MKKAFDAGGCSKGGDKSSTICHRLNFSTLIVKGVKQDKEDKKIDGLLKIDRGDASDGSPVVMKRLRLPAAVCRGSGRIKPGPCL